jgi:hypothetical protein
MKNNNTNIDNSEQRQFTATEGNVSIIVPESMFSTKNSRILVELLNEKGFNLGSGHDTVEIKKISDNEYSLIASPYPGHADQYVKFNSVEKLIVRQFVEPWLGTVTLKTISEIKQTFSTLTIYEIVGAENKEYLGDFIYIEKENGRMYGGELITHIEKVALDEIVKYINK